MYPIPPNYTRTLESFISEALAKSLTLCIQIQIPEIQVHVILSLIYPKSYTLYTRPQTVYTLVHDPKP